MPLPSSGYSTAVVLNPSAALSDFSLLIDLSSMPSEWWAAVDTPDGTKGRAATDAGTELASDWISFSDVNQTGWLRVKWAGTLAAAGTQTLRIYPPVAANASYAVGDTYGQYAAYDSNWKFYYPLENLLDRTSNQYTLSAVGSPTSGAAGKIGNGYAFNGSNQYLIRNSFSHTSWPVTIIGWAHPTSGQTYTPFGISNNSTFATVRPYLVSAGRINSLVDPVGNSQTGFSVWSYSWQQFGVRATNAYIRGIYNGAMAGSTVLHSSAFPAMDRISIGGAYFAWDLYNDFIGSVDDVQMHTAERSDAWIAHEYAQSNNQSAFWNVWNWVPSGGVALHPLQRLSGHPLAYTGRR